MLALLAPRCDPGGGRRHRGASETCACIHAGFAVPVAAVLAIAAHSSCSRRARRRLERTLGRAGGRRTARVGRGARLARALPRADRRRSRWPSMRSSTTALVVNSRLPCSRSATASARLVCGRASTFRRSSKRRRFVASTCARSRRSSSTCCPAQTYVKGFLRSYADYLGLDGQLYVDEFNSRYVRGELEEDPEEQAYRSPQRQARRAAAAASRARPCCSTIAVIAGLTVFVFAAWKWGGNENIPDLVAEPTARTGRAEADRQAGRLGGRGRRVRRSSTGARGPGRSRSTRERSRTGIRGPSRAGVSGSTSSPRPTCGCG